MAGQPGFQARIRHRRRSLGVFLESARCSSVQSDFPLLAAVTTTYRDRRNRVVTPPQAFPNSFRPSRCDHDNVRDFHHTKASGLRFTSWSLYNAGSCLASPPLSRHGLTMFRTKRWFVSPQLASVRRPRPMTPSRFITWFATVRWWVSCSCFVVSLSAGARFTSGQETSQQGLELFEQSIRPVLVEHCYECHSTEADSHEGGLVLSDKASLRAGGDSGAVIVPGAPDQSLLLKALRHVELEMPPDRRLPDTVIADFSRWIEIGAPDPRDGETSRPLVDSQIDWEQARQFWAFQSPAAGPLPHVQHANWPRVPLDYYVLAAMEHQQLAPSQDADPVKLLRRAAFDITGLPPSRELIERFLANPSTEAYETYVDQLIASPAFGERWARVWLDLARYAEDQAHIVGDNKSLFYPNAYLYRDWVIDSFNRDLPFDQFVRFQLAADLLGETGESHLAALGFLGLGPKYYDRGRLQVKAEEWEDRVDTVCRTLLGLTVACARCHDHKYDPIPTSDYYAMASIFASTEMFNRPLNDAVETKNGGQASSPDQAMHVVREGKPTDLEVFIRGDVENRGESVHRGFLRILSKEQQLHFENGSGRLELAEAIVSRSNPLSARVFVNRIWGQLIGAPIVATPSNFGTLGEPPTHPELLDHLAIQFMTDGWSLKRLVRTITTSATYRQTSVACDDAFHKDPSNRWLSHMHRKRLGVEAWRDALLESSGQLDARVGGPSMDPADANSTRRTVYASVSRFQLNPLLATFDFPDANVHAARRASTTTPLQKLTVLNHPLTVASAQTLGQHAASCAEEESAEQAVRWLYGRLFSRDPLPEEIELALGFVNHPLADSSPQGSARWSEYAHALIASNEMMFLD